MPTAKGWQSSTDSHVAFLGDITVTRWDAHHSYDEHAIHIFVDGRCDGLALAELMYRQIPVTTRTVGSEEVTIEGANGLQFTYRFSRIPDDA